MRAMCVKIGLVEYLIYTPVADLPPIARLTRDCAVKKQEVLF